MTINEAEGILNYNRIKFRTGTVTVASRHYGWLISYKNEGNQSKTMKLSHTKQQLQAAGRSLSLHLSHAPCMRQVGTSFQ